MKDCATWMFSSVLAALMVGGCSTSESDPPFGIREPDAQVEHDADSSVGEQPEDRDAAQEDAQGPSMAEAAGAFCEAHCARDQACSDEDSAVVCDESSCQNNAANWSLEYLSYLADCIDEIGCDKDDICYEQGVLDLFPNFMADPTIAECGRKADVCGFSKDLCATMAALNDDARAEADTCVALTCDSDIETCLRLAGSFTP